MKPLRAILFWTHLACGVVAGLVILDMSVTGALLAFKPQILRVVDRDVRQVTPPPGRSRRPASELMRRFVEQRPDAKATGIVAEADPSSPVAVTLDREATVYMDPYSGRVLGTGSAGAQGFFRTVEDWHRWLAVSGQNRATARAVTDASNFAFLLLAVTGLFLWWPRKWLPQHVKAILWFKRTTTGRARDFNWHNAVGFWCAPVLIVLTSTGVIMSYTWANDLLYQLSGSPVPAARRGPAGRGSAPRQGGDGPASVPANLDALWARAEQQVPGWRSITMRWSARPNAPVTFTITEPSWNAFARSQLSLNAVTAETVNWEPYGGQSLGQRMRQWARFAHTGELGRWPGQLLAAVACAGGSLLVLTGLALAWRRLIGWSLWTRVRRRRPVEPETPVVPVLVD